MAENQKSSETILEALNWRYAVKRFDPSRKIPDLEWRTLQESLRLAPSSYGLQAWKFIVVKNPELRAKLKEFSWNQGQITDASHLVVFAYKKRIHEEDVQRYMQSIAQTRGISIESLKGFQDMLMGDVVKGPRAAKADVWTQRQTYIAMGFLLESAALLKIDSCPMEGIDSSAYEKLLGLEGSDWGVIAAVTLGYRHPEDPNQNLKKSRFDANIVFDIRN